MRHGTIPATPPTIPCLLSGDTNEIKDFPMPSLLPHSSQRTMLTFCMHIPPPIPKCAVVLRTCRRDMPLRAVSWGHRRGFMSNPSKLSCSCFQAVRRPFPAVSGFACGMMRRERQQHAVETACGNHARSEHAGHTGIAGHASMTPPKCGQCRHGRMDAHIGDKLCQPEKNGDVRNVGKRVPIPCNPAHRSLLASR